jgi:hypothetical protein
MSRLAEVRSQLNQRGKSVVSYGADLVEWSAEKNLAIAADIASFAVAQIRLTVEAQDFPEYFAEVRGSISGLGETLQEHGQDYVAKIRGLPGDLRKVVNPAVKTSSRKTTVKKKAAARKSVKTKAA